MDVVVYMVLTEAVIAGTARAVTELQLGIVRVSPAAHRAFVHIVLVFGLVFYLPDFALEVHGVLSLLPTAGHYGVEQLSAAEEEVIEYRDER